MYYSTSSVVSFFPPILLFFFIFGAVNQGRRALQVTIIMGKNERESKESR